MSDFLTTMADASRIRAGRAASERQTLAQRALEASPTVPFPRSERMFAVIAEIKRVSPAEGELGRDDDIVARAERYAAGGAAAISVLTEPERFAGSLDDLAAVAAALPAVPVMRKDFLVDSVQLLEARAAGASGVLLIAAMLDDLKLDRLTRLAVDLGLFVLLEAFDHTDLTRISALLATSDLAESVATGQLLVGINSRDLRTLTVDAARLTRLARLLPPTATSIAESGIVTTDDAARAGRSGFAGALVGTALMRCDDPTRTLRQLAAAGREARA